MVYVRVAFLYTQCKDSSLDGVSIEFADIFLCYVATLGDYLGRIIFIASKMNCKLYWASCEGNI